MVLVRYFNPLALDRMAMRFIPVFLENARPGKADDMERKSIKISISTILVLSMLLFACYVAVLSLSPFP